MKVNRLVNWHCIFSIKWFSYWVKPKFKYSYKITNMCTFRTYKYTFRWLMHTWSGLKFKSSFVDWEYPCTDAIYNSTNIECKCTLVYSIFESWVLYSTLLLYNIWRGQCPASFNPFVVNHIVLPHFRAVQLSVFLLYQGVTALPRCGGSTVKYIPC